MKHLGETSTGGLAAKRFVIEDIYPTVDGGRFPVKRIAGEPVEVWADVFRDGHEVIAAAVRWRPRASIKSDSIPSRAAAEPRFILCVPWVRPCLPQS